LERCGPETQRTFGFTGTEFIEGTLWERRLIDPAVMPVPWRPASSRGSMNELCCHSALRSSAWQFSGSEDAGAPLTGLDVRRTVEN
jgi:hypothetical protein